jgi:hypothetical protein
LWTRGPATRPEPERRTPETTGTQESFATVPATPEPTEPLLNQETIITPESININMADHEEISLEIMDIDNSGTKKGEIKLNQPKPFTGKREELKKFLQDVKLYLLVNHQIYDNNIKKIAFALSFMNEGDAASYKEQLLEEAMAKDNFDLGDWEDFETDLRTAFSPYDAPGDALEEMKTLRMGNNSIEEHNARFKMIVTKSGLSPTSPAVIDYYRETLSIPLQRRILSLESPPTTLLKWYEWAAKLDNNWRRMQRVLGRSKETNERNYSGRKKDELKKRFNFTRKDPNAMDVDALTTEKRDEAMKKGLCFGCGKPGHLNRDCPDKKKTTTPPPPKKMAGKELYAHIRSLTAVMSEEEKEKFYKEAEDEGF